MLAKSTLVVLTTALALLTLGPYPSLSLPIEDNNNEATLVPDYDPAPHIYTATAPHPPMRTPSPRWGGGSSGGGAGNGAVGGTLRQQQPQQQQQQQQRPFGVEHHKSVSEGGKSNSSNNASNFDRNSTTNSTNNTNITDNTNRTEQLDDDFRLPQFYDGDPKECDLPPRMLRFVGVDLRENSFAVGYVNAKGKIELIPNEEGELYTPTEVRFIEGGRRAVIGRGAWEKDQNGSVVDLAGMRYPETYYTYPEGVRFSLSRDYRSTEAEEYYRVSEREHMTDKKEISSYRRYMAPDMTEKEVQESPMRLHEMRNNQGGDILAVVMRRAMDIVEARLPEGEKVERVVLTLPHGTEEEPRDPYSMPAGLMSDRSMEMTKAMLAMPMKSLSHHFETLALAVAHVEYFESRVQVDPRGGEEGEDMYLSQMVLLYNLRDKTEDLVVMEYFKGEFKGPFVFNQNPAFEHSTFHIKELGGYLPHEERIEDGFRSFVMMACLDRFNRGVGATGGDLKSKERVEIVDMDRFNHTVEQLDTLCETTSPTTADQDDLVQSFIELGPHSSVRLTCKQLKEIKFEFMKARLSRAVDKVLSASGLENKAAVDHLIVADASGFRGQSTQAMEAVFAAENKLAVKEVDPQTAILKGIVAAAEIASQDSILEIHMHCYRMLLANNLRMPDTKYKLLV